MSNSNDNPKTGVNDAAIMLSIMAMVVLLSIIPPAIILACVRFAHRESQRPHPIEFQNGHRGISADHETAEYLRRNVPPREGTLPTSEQPIDSGTHHKPLFRRVRAVVLKLRGVAGAAGEAVALRSREVFDKVRGRISGPLDGCSRRYSGNIFLPSSPDIVTIPNETKSGPSCLC